MANESLAIRSSARIRHKVIKPKSVPYDFHMQCLDEAEEAGREAAANYAAALLPEKLEAARRSAVTEYVVEQLRKDADDAEAACIAIGRASSVVRMIARSARVDDDVHTAEAAEGAAHMLDQALCDLRLYISGVAS